MSLRFASQLCIDNLPDEQLNNQFEVIMPALNLYPTKNDTGFFNQAFYAYQPIVEEIIFGYKNFKVDTRRVRTGWFGVPSDIERFHEIKITMFCPESMETQYYLEAWRRLIFNEEGEYYEPFSNYKKNIEVFINGSTPCHITLQGCFPFMEKDFEFEYTDDPKRFRILATFNVDNVKVDMNNVKKAVVKGIVNSPTSLLDKAISQSSSSTYDIGDTYGGKMSASINNNLQKYQDKIKGIF